jgi:hypothetical protein
VIGTAQITAATVYIGIALASAAGGNPLKPWRIEHELKVPEPWHHLPPRAVAMPRPFKTAAISGSDFAPAA